jgi:hypothetical protein
VENLPGALGGQLPGHVLQFREHGLRRAVLFFESIHIKQLFGRQIVGAALESGNRILSKIASSAFGLLAIG